jgi:predicted DNA-binding protein
MSPTGGPKVLHSSIMIRMPADLREALQKLADKDRRPLSDYCRLALEAHIESQKRKGK